jgi:hypothetical protein
MESTFNFFTKDNLNFKFFKSPQQSSSSHQKNISFFSSLFPARDIFPPLITLFPHTNEEIGNSYLKYQFQKAIINVHKAEEFFHQISGGIPREILIRELLFKIFPLGMNNISLRKIRRLPILDLLRIIGENLFIIKMNLTHQIQEEWLKICFEKLRSAQRNKRDDFLVLNFAIEFLNQSVEF